MDQSWRAALVILAVMACQPQGLQAAGGRQLAQTAAAPAPSAAVAALLAPLTAAETQLVSLTASAAITQLCSRNITAVQYASAILKQVKMYTCINAFAALDPAKVLADAKSVDDKYAAGMDIKPLCGIVFAVKDNIDVLGYPTVAGTPALEGAHPPASSPIVTRLLKANGVVLGKTRMHELANGITSINPYYGPVLNPHNPAMHVGGSSGGSAASVAAHAAPAAFCTDTGGSCRIPAAMNGIVGLRPSMGCYNAGGGFVPMTTTRDTVGLMAREVADVSMFNAIFSDCHKGYSSVTLKGTKIGYSLAHWANVTAEINGTLTAALNALTAAGVTIVPFDMTDFYKNATQLLNDGIFYTYEMPREMPRYLQTHGYELSYYDLVDKVASPGVLRAQKSYRDKPLDTFPTPTDYVQTLRTGIPTMKAMWNDYFTSYGFDTFLVPGSGVPARPIYDTEPYLRWGDNKTYVSTGNGINNWGQQSTYECPIGAPGLVIPAGMVTEVVMGTQMPITLQLFARTGDDDTLLSVGQAIQPLFATVPAPPATPLCYGCTPVVKVPNFTVGFNPARLGGKAVPAANETTSYYSLSFNGTCTTSNMLPATASS
ncbi:hypothetical protein WJX72_004169 [[Myrmecia] bisecta]|uniref:Amidase domain-containing protein n=1 Tax=[Myrmecia] bisecta TaxID=41462 RepID=A0AAW1PVL9_9CHLO